jgi:hypothetical protein
LWLATTMVAVVAALASILPQRVGNALTQLLTGGIPLAATGWLATGLLVARGERQAFCLGGLVVFASLWTSAGGSFLEGFAQLVGFPLLSLGLTFPLIAWLKLLGLGVAAYANGRLCVRAYRFYAGATVDE